MIGNGESSTRVKRVRREPQTRPLIVSAARSRVTEQVLMSAPMARELRGYVRWAAKESGIEADEALVLTLDRALTDLLKKDTLWQAQKGGAASPKKDEGRPSLAPARTFSPSPAPPALPATTRDK
jgi:hypothetical protein